MDYNNQVDLIGWKWDGGYQSLRNIREKEGQGKID